MPIKNIDSVVSVFANVDRAAMSPEVRKARRRRFFSVEPEGARFQSTFDVESIRFRSGAGDVHATLRRLPALSDRLLPVPAGLNVSALGALLEGPDLSVETGRFRLNRIMDTTAHVAVAAGRLDESPERRRFLAIASPDAQEFSMHVTASVTTATGVTYALTFAADGGVLPDGRNENGFVAGLDGSLFDLAPLGGEDGPRISARFGELDRLRFSEADESTTIELAGTVLIGDAPVASSVVLTIGLTTFAATVIDAGDGLPRFAASASIERANIALFGVRPPERGASTGAITLFERASLEELMRFPLSGRITGLAWDGTFLWQALWPSGDLLRIDPARHDGAPQVFRGWNEGKVAGLAADGDFLVMGVCKANILRSAGGTALSLVDRRTGEERHRCDRPHVVGSGISAFEGNLLGSVNGADMTPFTSDSGLVVMDKETGRILETIVLPRNFFVEDVTTDDEGTVLLSVTEGLAARGARGAVYELRRVTE